MWLNSESQRVKITIIIMRSGHECRQPLMTVQKGHIIRAKWRTESCNFIPAVERTRGDVKATPEWRSAASTWESERRRRGRLWTPDENICADYRTVVNDTEAEWRSAVWYKWGNRQRENSWLNKQTVKWNREVKAEYHSRLTETNWIHLNLLSYS